MITKIDISSLDEATKNKIVDLKKRCSELGVGEEVVVNLPITITYGWYEGRSGLVHEWGNYPKSEINWEIVKQNEKEIQQKLDAEIKSILDFSDSIADQLGVDKTEFWNQYFLA